MKYVVVAALLTVTTLLAFSGKKPKNDNRIVLSDNNTVSLNMPITGDVANDIQKKLLEKSDSLSNNKPIYLVLNSPGGSIDAGNKIIAVAKSLPQKVHTITMFSASMSFQISQNLGERYILPDGVMMSHRAAVGGVEGNIPGSALNRLYFLLETVTRLDAIVAERAHMDLEMYQNMISSELWMGSEQATTLKFADKEVEVYCDKTLRGDGPVQKFSWIFGTVEVTFDKCPLITTPTIREGEKAVYDLLIQPREKLVKTFSY